MAIIKTGKMFHTLTYGGICSGDYGIYISGEGVYDAPVRSVELVEIPGRNGFVPMDNGRFDNIEIEYPAGVFGMKQAEFREALSDFRNAIMSQTGYQVLEDTYHPDEYRKAMYISGLEVEPVQMGRAGEFTLKFNCAPQRFLKVGDVRTRLISGEAIVNPTPFESRPLLELTGSGSIVIGGQTITVNNDLIGNIVLRNERTYTKVLQRTLVFDTQYANNGDEIVYNGNVVFQTQWAPSSGYVTGGTASCTSGGEASVQNMLEIVQYYPVTYNYGTSHSGTVTATFDVTTSGGSTGTGTIDLTVTYDGDDQIALTASMTLPGSFTETTSSRTLISPQLILYSTQSVLGNPLYLDLDIGECYKIENGSTVSINNGIELPADLPTIPAGSSVITFDNTFTQIDLVPRWWKI